MRQAFECCGKIDYIRVLQTDRGCKGVSFVCFKSPDAVPLALELNGTLLLDRPMNVERYKETKLKRSDKIKVKFSKKKKNPSIVSNVGKKKSPIKPKSPIAKQAKDGKKKNKEFLGVKSNDKKKVNQNINDYLAECY